MVGATHALSLREMRVRASRSVAAAEIDGLPELALIGTADV